MFEKLARKILTVELSNMKDNYNRKIKEEQVLTETYKKQFDGLNNFIIQNNNTIRDLKEQIKDLQHENDILKHHFKVNEEPTEEEMREVRLELKIHELEQQIRRYQSCLDAYQIALPMAYFNNLCSSNYFHSYNYLY